MNCVYPSTPYVKVEEAVKLAAEYNRQLNQERRERRNGHFDMQTYTVHYPMNGKGRMKVRRRVFNLTLN